MKLSITTHRIIFALESVLVLLPITVIAFIGGSYLLLIMLGQELFSVPVKALGISVTTVIGMVGLIALWVLVVQALSQFQLLGRKTEKRIRLLAHLGAGLGVLALFSLSVVMFIPLMKDGHFTSLSVFAVGSPALLPYAHFLYLRREPPMGEAIAGLAEET